MELIFENVYLYFYSSLSFLFSSIYHYISCSTLCLITHLKCKFLLLQLAFPKLKALEISQMENIKRIWHGQLSTIESLGDLKEIRVSHCKNLSSVFPTSIIQGPLQLEILEIDSCGMEEIFVKEDGIETPAGDIFPKLTYLALKNLKELKHFYLGKHISKWALLKNLEVRNCDKVEILFQEFDQEANLDNQAQQPFFFVEAV